MGWFTAIGSFLKGILTAIPILERWFGDTRTVEDKIEDRAEDNAKDISKDQKKKRPGKPWFIFLFLFVSASCDPIIIPGNKIRYLIDTNGAECAKPPRLNANTGSQNDSDVMKANGYYVHSPAVELELRNAFARCQEQLRACRKK